MSQGLQVIILTVVMAGALGVMGFLGIKAALYILKGIFKNEKVKG